MDSYLHTFSGVTFFSTLSFGEIDRSFREFCAGVPESDDLALWHENEKEDDDLDLDDLGEPDDMDNLVAGLTMAKGIRPPDHGGRAASDDLPTEVSVDSASRVGEDAWLVFLLMQWVREVMSDAAPARHYADGTIEGAGKQVVRVYCSAGTGYTKIGQGHGLDRHGAEQEGAGFYVVTKDSLETVTVHDLFKAHAAQQGAAPAKHKPVRKVAKKGPTKKKR